MAKFGIAGFGGRGKLVGRKLAELGAEVLGVYDSNSAQLIDAPFRTFTNLGDLLKLDIDALVIATWPSSHAEVAVEALERDLDIFVEKPMGANVDQSRRIVEAQRRAGRLVAVGYVERVNPAISKLVEVADVADIIRSREIRVGLAPPTIDKAGVLLDLGSHGIDMAYHLFRVEPKVRTANLTAEREGDPEYECMIELDCGSTRSYVEARYASIRRRRLELETQQEYYEVTYTPAALKIGFPPPKLRKRPRTFEDLEQLSRNLETIFDLTRREPINAMLQLFLESVKKGSLTDPLCTAEQALVTVQAIEDARKRGNYRFIKRVDALS